MSKLELYFDSEVCSIVQLKFSETQSQHLSIVDWYSLKLLSSPIAPESYG